MKIKGIFVVGQKVELKRVCNHCEHELKGNEKFCPECGHKLTPCPRDIDMRVVVNILNDSFCSGGLFKEINAEESKKEGLAENPASALRCPYGLEKDRCGYCRGSDHACTMTVLASMPPQYNVCPHYGEGYVKC